jgi:UDP-glucose 4-epimerase
MRIVVVGASGNVGTSVLRSLANEPSVDSVLGVARRRPEQSFAKTDWAVADVGRDALVPLFRGADCVVHLAWLIQPSHDRARLWLTNVHGSRRVFGAVVEADVPALVYASSVGAYSLGPKDQAVDESWPTDGIQTSSYARHKAAVERELDLLEREHPDVRIVRFRPGFIFKREAGSGVRRLFLGPFVPSPLVRPGLLPFVPEHPRLRFQCVHSYDVGEACRLAVIGDARGAFNLATDPVLDGQAIARVLRSRTLRVSPRVAHAFFQLTWKLRLQPVDGGWLDLAYGVPLLNASRARRELGWKPRYDAEAALLDLTHGIAEGAGLDTPPLTPETSRLEEIATRVGGTEHL